MPHLADLDAVGVEPDDADRTWRARDTQHPLDARLTFSHHDLFLEAF